MTNKTTVKAAIQKSAEGYPLLGWILYWSTNGFREPVSKVKAALSQIGIDEAYAKLIAPSTALSAAFDQATLGQKNLKRQSVRNEAATFICLVRGEIAGNDALFGAATKGHLTANDDCHIEGDFADQIRDDFHRRLGEYSNNQFVGLVKAFLKDEASSLTLRDSGGVYFVPASKKIEFDKISALFAAFPESAQLEIVPVIDTAQAKKSVWAALTADIEGEIASLNEEIAKWSEEGDPRDGVVARRFDQYRTLKEKVEDYASLLSGTATGLEQKLEQVATELRKKL